MKKSCATIGITRAQIEDACARGLTRREAAAELGCSYVNICARARHLDIEPWNRRISDNQRNFGKRGIIGRRHMQNILSFLPPEEREIYRVYRSNKYSPDEALALIHQRRHRIISEAENHTSPIAGVQQSVAGE